MGCLSWSVLSKSSRFDLYAGVEASCVGLDICLATYLFAVALIHRTRCVYVRDMDVLHILIHMCVCVSLSLSLSLSVLFLSLCSLSLSLSLSTSSECGTSGI